MSVGLIWFHSAIFSIKPSPFHFCLVASKIKSSLWPLTVEQAELQQRCQRRDDHEGEQAAAPAHQAHGRAQRQAGGHGDAGHGVVVRVAERGGPSLGVHHAAGEAVVDPVTRQPVRTTPWRSRREWIGLGSARREWALQWHTCHHLSLSLSLACAMGCLMCNSCSQCYIDDGFDHKGVEGLYSDYSWVSNTPWIAQHLNMAIEKVLTLKQSKSNIGNYGLCDSHHEVETNANHNYTLSKF